MNAVEERISIDSNRIVSSALFLPTVHPCVTMKPHSLLGETKQSWKPRENFVTVSVMSVAILS